MKDVIKQLRNIDHGDIVRVETTEDVVVGTVVDYSFIDPDDYAAGEINIGIELLTDKHDIPETYPTESAYISASQIMRQRKFSNPVLRIWNPVYDDNDPTLIVDDEWDSIGDVIGVEIIDCE